MDAVSTNRVQSLTPDDPTLDAASIVATGGDEGRCAKVALVEGSGPGMSAETECLLRTRLRAAALVLFVGSTAFLLNKLFWRGLQETSDPALRGEDQFVLWFHVFHVLAMGAMSAMLCRRCGMSLAKLRAVELFVFGMTGAFFVAMQHFSTLLFARSDNLFNPAGMWLALMFTYATFIPNGWRRAAAVVGAMAIAPVATMGFDIARYPEVARLASMYEYTQVTGVVLFVLVGFGAAVYGTYLMGALRREAFEARRLGQYRLRHRIGAGGMGEVYLAEHQLLKRPCAIKIIRPAKAQDPRTLARFEREVRATAQLSHWNTVEVFDFGSTEEGVFYYVMEYLPGLSLAELVDRYGPLPAERTIYLLEQTCDALAEAHSQGLIHRDLKPGNIFAAQRGGIHDVAKLLDFGLAKPLAESQSTQLTQEGTITGSPLYMSPEQALGDRDPDARSDIYSLGAVAYYLLTGQPPFDRDKPLQVLIAHAHDPVVPPSSLQPSVPLDLEEVVLKCLAKRPEDRFQDVASLAEALKACSAAGGWSREDAREWWASRGAVHAEQESSLAAPQPV